MHPIFSDLGTRVLARWKQANFSLDAFPGIAADAFAEFPPGDAFDLNEFLGEFLLNDEQPDQSNSGFGQPEIIAYEHPRFYIQILFWLDGTTEIHQHGFSGAFHVMAGSSIHARYVFAETCAVTPHLRVGDLKMSEIELLETGRTVEIKSGPGCIHSLFHLDTPSITVVIRTQHDPGSGPQMNYHPPHVAIDPDFTDALMLRRNQLLDLMEHVEDPLYVARVIELISELDFERGYSVLEHSMQHLDGTDAWSAVLDAFQRKHGSLADGIPSTLAEMRRRESIKAFRSEVIDTEHRFFLALLMNVDRRSAVLKLVSARFPSEPPEDTIVRWAVELINDSGFEVSILDASVEMQSEMDGEDMVSAVISVFADSLCGRSHSESNEVPDHLRGVIREALDASSLRVLLRDG